MGFWDGLISDKWIEYFQTFLLDDELFALWSMVVDVVLFNFRKFLIFVLLNSLFGSLIKFNK